MQKFIIAALALIAIGTMWYLFTAGNTAEYTKTVVDEVTALENELAAVDAAVTAGTLTPEQATEAKVKIITRLANIDQAVAEAQKATLTQSQKDALAAGLRKLVTALERYKDALTAVDDTAIASEVEAKLDEVDNVDADLSGDTALSDVIDTMVDSVEEAANINISDDTETENGNDTSTTTVEVSDTTEAENDTSIDTDMTEDETTPTMEMPAQDSSTTDEMIIETSSTDTAESEVAQ